MNIELKNLPPVQEENEKHLVRYKNFISSRPIRQLKQKGFHTHRIVPRSLGGSEEDSNLIELTSREHFIAHLILWKCGYKEMVCAFFFMSHTKRYDGKVTGRLYERLEKQHSEQTSKRFLGVSFTKEHCEKIRKSNTGKIKSRDTIEKIRKARIGTKDSIKTKKKKSEAHIGEKNHMYGKDWRVGKTKEELVQHSKKLSEKNSGENNPMYGRSSLEFKSEEEKLAISQKRKNTCNNRTEEEKLAIHKTFSQFMWVTNEKIDIRIKKDEMVPLGFRKGRKKQSNEQRNKTSERRKNTFSITNGKENHYVNLGDLIPFGWRKGCTKGNNNGK